MSTKPLLNEIERAFPERPFTIELWDGSRIPSTNGGGPTFRARSKDALAYAVASPGQLGLGRAYVAGEIQVDDMDAVIGLLNDWQPPPVGAAAQARMIAAAPPGAGRRRPQGQPKRRRAAGRRRAPPAAGAEGRDPPPRAQAHERARPRGRPPPLRRRQRVLLPLPRRVDDLLLRDLLPRRQDARGGAGDQARPRLHQARSPGRRAGAGRGLRLG